MIRHAQITDVPAVVPLYRALVEEMAELAPSLYQPLQENPGFGLVETIEDEARALLLALNDNGTIIGFALVSRANNAPQDGVVPDTFGLLIDLYVTPKARRTGYGRELLTASENWTREQGLKRLQLNVPADNPRAERLYKNSGYQPLYQTLSRFLDER